MEINAITSSSSDHNFLIKNRATLGIASEAENSQSSPSTEEPGNENSLQTNLQQTPTSRIESPSPIIIVASELCRTLGPNPVRMTCPQCRVEIITRTKHRGSCAAYLGAGIICLLGMACCVCCPSCIESCLGVSHECPNCQALIGVHKSCQQCA